MSWYALEKIDEAFEETKELLLPFDLGTWARLAVIIVFTGGGFGGLFNVPASMPSDTGTNDFSTTSTSSTAYAPQSSLQATPEIPDITGTPATGLATAAPSASVIFFSLAIIGGIALAFLYLGSVFEFIFYQSLLDEKVKIRNNFRKHAGKGLHYFGFKLFYLALLVALIAVVAGLFMINPVAGALGLIAFIPVFILWAILGGLVHDFALLSMIENDAGIIEGWKQVWPELKTQREQLGMYLVIRFFLNLTIGVLTFMIAALATLILAIPLAIIGVILAAVSEVLVLIPVILGIAIWVVLMLFIAVPFRTFFYHWLILVYHDFTS